jgi:photosystem II stability/assembly factor-like uncharacterized protein
MKMRPTWRLFLPSGTASRIAIKFCAIVLIITVNTAARGTTEDKSRAPVVKVVSGGESALKPEDCIRTLVGPAINAPDSFPGWGGFLGWVSPVRLRNGDWLVGFSAGYWHASPPTPLLYSKEKTESYIKLGFPPDFPAPTGGRAMMIRSTDQGRTWTRPVTIIDTPDDDRHPSFVETPDGTIICSMFTFSGAEREDILRNPSVTNRAAVIRSFDHGKTWEQKVIRIPSPFISEETDGPMVVLKDGSVIMTINGAPAEREIDQAAVFRSNDKGASWNLLSTISSGTDSKEVIKTELMDTKKDIVVSEGHDLFEANTAVLKDGRWVMIARPGGDICWSDDEGRSWTKPVTFGMRIFAPSLYVLSDGTLVCLHGSYDPGFWALRVIFSTDGGHTWIAPSPTHGFLVSNCYGYAKAMELPDGSLFIVDQDTGGHRSQDARSMSLRCLRLRIRPDHSGIELLPAN